jgi:Putative metallopeptidase
MVTNQLVQGLLVGISAIVMLAQPVTVSAENPFKSASMDRGKITLIFEKPKKQVYRDIRSVFIANGRFDDIVQSLNKEFIFPDNITAKFADEDGPFYDPGKREVIMSYSFIFYLSTLYFERYPKASDDDMISFSERAAIFLFYHELAHAMIDVYQLPIVSNEETAADNLAMILALEYHDDGFNVIMDTAELFDLLDGQNNKKISENDYWDEHALDAQRFYNILCLAYGVYPDKVKKIVKDSKNPKLREFLKERGEACSYLYDQQLTAWARLLKPYFR